MPPIRLDIGSSFSKLTGYIGIDVLPSKGVDIVADACNLPIKTSCVAEIYSSYCLEHIFDQLAVIQEIHRVCQPDANVRLILPHFSNPSYYDDLTHHKLYSARSFEHFDQALHTLTGYPNYLPQINLKTLSAELRWWPPQVIERKKPIRRTLLKILNAIINRLANAYPFFCERIWCRWVGGFYEIDFNLKVVK
ncbi:MAG: hypothetical protein FJY65_07845 [Calditrichaeota bacterium]|nr:hypothetical protein [Calditrichota bacterium]